MSTLLTNCCAVVLRTLGKNVAFAMLVLAAWLVVLSAGNVSGQEIRPIHSSVVFPGKTVLNAAPENRQYYVTCVAVADLNGDGRPDVLATSPSMIAWYPNLGGGIWGSRLIISTGLRGPNSVVAADLDGDNRLDVASASLPDDRVAWFKNMGGNLDDGFFAATPRVVSTTADGAFSVAVANLNGDTLPDLVSTSLYDHKVAWYPHLSLGFPGLDPFGVPPLNQNVISTEGRSPSFVTNADLDGDGLQDLVVTTRNDNTIAWFKCSLVAGLPQFTRHIISSSQLRVTAATTADMDGDGWLDVICAAPFGNAISWFRNTTHDAGSVAPFFGPAQIVSGNMQGAFGVSAADLNRDGRPDLVGVAYLTNKVSWFANLGGGNFGWNAATPGANENLISTNTFSPATLATADFDQDGAIDVVVGSQDDGEVAVYLNKGGQCALSSSDTSSGVMFEGQRDDVLCVSLSNRGLPGDDAARVSTLGLFFETSPGVAMTSAEANALIENLHIYVDANGSGNFERNSDRLVASQAELTLAEGRLSFSFTGSQLADVQIAPGSTRQYFVVLELTGNAAAQSPNRFRVMHRSQGVGRSLLLDAVSGVLLTVEPAVNPDTPSSTITARSPQSYSDWVAMNYSAGVTETGPSQSPLNDGTSNLLKYAFAIDPLAITSGAALPKITAEGNVRIYRHVRPSWAADLNYHYELSRDLVTWTSAVANTDYQRLDYPLSNGMIGTDLTILGNWTKTFLRVRVELAN